MFELPSGKFMVQSARKGGVIEMKGISELHMHVWAMWLYTALFMSINSRAQEWVDKTYTYDSLLNVEYGTALNFLGEETTLKMDVFFPVCDLGVPSAERPLLLWIHGGAFLAGDKNDASIQYLCRQFAMRGYVTASIDYRLGFVSDDQLWQCNYPSYNCVFAADSSEWSRAYYRAVQDAKGALRFLVNRHDLYGIDVDNVFVAGESAGALTALGAALLDTLIERPPHTVELPPLATPHPGSWECLYNQGAEFPETIERPDLGDIDGNIEPSSVDYTIRGIGNMYGAMLTDLLRHQPEGAEKPGIYSFHQPCDIVVPIDSNYVYWGLSWCFTNGYNCYGIANNRVKLYGSRAFANWNNSNDYGYVIQSEFTSVNFPYNFWLGSGSCVDQVNNPCHAYDNRNLREQNLALFFADMITSDPACESTISVADIGQGERFIHVYPNPAQHTVTLFNPGNGTLYSLEIVDLMGKSMFHRAHEYAESITIDVSGFSQGIYHLIVRHENEWMGSVRIVRE